jgi:hypothetical protein
MSFKNPNKLKKEKNKKSAFPTKHDAETVKKKKPKK